MVRKKKSVEKAKRVGFPTHIEFTEDNDGPWEYDISVPNYHPLQINRHEPEIHISHHILSDPVVLFSQFIGPEQLALIVSNTNAYAVKNNAGKQASKPYA